jgi:hypothetical protein
MNAEEVLTELKAKAQPTYGTNQEKKDRLKKLNGNHNNIFNAIRYLPK